MFQDTPMSQAQILQYYGAVWHCCLNNSFQCLNDDNTFDIYFYKTQTRISKILKTEQQYLSTVTKRTLSYVHVVFFKKKKERKKRLCPCG